MRRVYIFLAFLLVLVTAEELPNALTTVDPTKILTPEGVITQISWNVQKKMTELFTRIVAGIPPMNEDEKKIMSTYGSSCTDSEKLDKWISEMENANGDEYNKFLDDTSFVLYEKAVVISQMLDLGLDDFIYVDKLPSTPTDVKDYFGKNEAKNEKANAQKLYSDGVVFPQGYEASMKFLDFIGPAFVDFEANRIDLESESRMIYRLKFVRHLDVYVTNATVAVFKALPKEKLAEYIEAIKEFTPEMFKEYVGVPLKSITEPEDELPSPEPVVESSSLLSETPELVSEPKTLLGMINEIVEEVKEESSKEEVADVIENLINGESISDEDAELAKKTGLAELSNDELEAVIEKIEENVDNEVEEDAQCGESTDEVEDVLTDTLVDKVKDKLDIVTEETIDDLMYDDKALGELEKDIADEFELKDKTNEDLEAELDDLKQGEGDLPKKITEIIEEILPEELEEIDNNEDEDVERPIEDSIEEVIEEIPGEIVDIINEVPEEDIDEVIKELDEEPVKNLEDKHEKELEKEAEEKTKEPYECSCDCDRK